MKKIFQFFKTHGEHYRNYFSNSYVNFLLKNKKLVALVGITSILVFQEKILIHTIQTYRLSKCVAALQERFGYTDSKKFKKSNITDENLNLICTIYPTNSYDVTAIFSIAKQYNVSIMLDANDNQNNIQVPFIKVDMSNYNKITKFEKDNKRIQVEVGLKIKDLLQFLEKEGLTIPFLENIENQNLTINDVIFNNYNGFSKRKFIDDYIDNIEVAIPKEGGRILKSKQNDEITLSGVNFKKTNSTFGIVLNCSFKISKKKQYEFIIYENEYDKITGLAEDLLLQKKALGIKDLMITNVKNLTEHEKKKYQLHVKVSQDKFDLWKTDLNGKYGNFSIGKNYPTQYTQENTVIRKIKLNVPKKHFLKMLRQIIAKAELYNLNLSIKSSVVYNEYELEIFNQPNTKIMNAFKFINNIHGLILNYNGNIFINNHLKVNSKSFLMRDLGFGNYIINEDLKAVFDPKFLLNPHLSIIKPHPLKTIKRENKHLNYILNKIDL